MSAPQKHAGNLSNQRETDTAIWRGDPRFNLGYGLFVLADWRKTRRVGIHGKFHTILPTANLKPL
ncbi:hypothetical protein, partial [Loktanella sp. S4079]|uniref:hypothetical protein n=1 Tax=Loktanella sp. S4079 TaxID=579483 RepID=UPI00194E1D7C